MADANDWDARWYLTAFLGERGDMEEWRNCARGLMPVMSLPPRISPSTVSGTRQAVQLTSP
jgi:hypothetical protein